MTTPSPGTPGIASRASRSVAMGRKGMIATSQPQASIAGLEMLRDGGNAIDAAVTAAAVLSVVEPTMTGIGGDLFAIVHDASRGTTRGLNASGRSAYSADLDHLQASGHTCVPEHGVLSATVPGAVDGWNRLLADHGTVPLERALAPAVTFARDGFPVAEVVARQWNDAASLLAADPTTAALFLPKNRAPIPGELFVNRPLADSLEAIASEGPDVLYRGALGHAIASDMARRGGWLTTQDLDDHRSDWMEPIRTSIGEVELLELPPNTQGFVAIEALNILANDDLSQLGHNSGDYLHLVLEALAVAFDDRAAYLADPDAVPDETLARLISPAYAEHRRRQISSEHVRSGETDPSEPDAIIPKGATGDTVYLAAADAQGNLISLIQSLYSGFGGGIVAGSTGIVLHNRGSLFNTDPLHPNHLAPYKRPLHTLAPAMVCRRGRPWLAFGVMGGDMQPQGHLQVLLNLTCFGMNIQEAGEAPRARYDTSGICLEQGIPETTATNLRHRGHTLIDGLGFGGFQGVLIDFETGTLMGGSDPRKDGLALGW